MRQSLLVLVVLDHVREQAPSVIYQSRTGSQVGLPGGVRILRTVSGRRASLSAKSFFYEARGISATLQGVTA